MEKESPAVAFEPLFAFIAYALASLEIGFNKIPGSAVILRYVKSSHKNDPGRTILELFLAIFAIRTLLQSRTRAERTGKHFIQFSEQEIDELVDEWTPEPLSAPLNPMEREELDSVNVVSGPNGSKPRLSRTGTTVLNLASFNFTGLAGNEHIKQRAVETLRRYGLGSCGPPGFYGTLDVHMDLERDIAEFLGTESAILYSQTFSTISSVIPAFCKRGDIIVADRGVNFVIQKGIQISRSTVRWYDHNDLNSLEQVLEGIEKERKKKRGPLTRRFIITEGIFERDGVVTDLPTLIELKFKYKYRLILDESFSFGTVGHTGRGLTEFFNVAAEKVDMLIGSVANSLCSSGGFCAGSRAVVDHQRINGPSFVFSASIPALLSVSASEGIRILRSAPSSLSALRDNIKIARAILDPLDCISIPSHFASPIIHIYIRSPAIYKVSSNCSLLQSPNPTLVAPKDVARSEWDIDTEEQILQEVVDEALSHDVMITKAKRLRGQELTEPRPSIRLAMTSALNRMETERAVGAVKVALLKTLVHRSKSCVSSAL